MLRLPGNQENKSDLIFLDGFNIVSLTDPQFVSDLFDKISDIKIIHDSDNSAATGALDKHELKV
jgi:hypothetical protein